MLLSSPCMQGYLYKVILNVNHMRRRFLSSFIDLAVVLIFCFLFWSVLENATGTLFNFYFIDENDGMKNVRIFTAIFLGTSLLYHSVISLQGLSLGKRLTGCSIEKDSEGRMRLLLKELLLKWFVFYAFPFLFMLLNFKAGFIVFFVLYFCYIIASLIIWRKKRMMPIDWLTGITVLAQNSEESSNVKRLWLSISALLIDASIIICMTTVVSTFIVDVFNIDFFDLFFIVSLIYLLINAINKGLSVGKLMVGLRITKHETSIKFYDAIQWEIFLKYCTLIFVPYIILRSLGIHDPYCIMLNIISIVGFLAILYFSYHGAMWWSKNLKTQKSILNGSFFQTTLTFFSLILFWSVSFVFVQLENNQFQNSKLTWLGFEYPFKFHIAKNISTDEHVAFLSRKHESPKEYILNLFTKYDVVVLCENFHGEKTQWDLVYDIVSDKRFIENAGAIFTEYGSAIHQNKVDQFLGTHFDNDTARQKEAASIMWYMSGGFYEFLVNLNKLNSNLHDSLKVREYFTDIIDWDYFPLGSRHNIPNIENRDSLMAKVTIDWYNRAEALGAKKKCLVITNFRHAFGYPNGIDLVKSHQKYLKLTSGNQGQYLFEAIPKRVANVLQLAPNSITKSFFFPFRDLIQKGKWDRAFEKIGNQPMGFDFKDSPFGADGFDMYPLRGALPILSYQDLFTGLIFNKPFDLLISTDYPYQRYAMEQEYSRKQKLLPPSKLDYIEEHFSNHAGLPDHEKWKVSICLINHIKLFSLSIMICLGFLIAGFHYFRLLFGIIQNKYCLKH